MALIIIGILVFLVGLALRKREDLVRKFSGAIRTAGLLFILLGVLIGIIPRAVFTTKR